MTIEECIRQHALKIPDKPAVIYGGKSTSYFQLWNAVASRSEEMSDNGIVAGSLNIFRSTQSPDFVVEYLATHLSGAVAVPLEKDCSQKRFDRLMKEYGNIVLSSEEGHQENIADVLFTTGSTGEQKGVMESYRAIWADADNLIHAQGFNEDTVFVICGPLNHIGSLSKIWPVLMLGGTLIILDGMKDINAFFHALAYPHGKIATFMVPASIRMALQLGIEKISLIADRLDFVETGGAAISQTDMDALCRLLPHARLYNTYASTETGIVCTYDYNHNPCVAGCTGRHMRNSSVSITPEGTIACSGATLMSGYLADEKLTASVLHDGMMFTNDIGELDSEGYLHIKGRNSDVINIGGYKVSPLEVEDAAISFPEIIDCICFLTHSSVFGDAIKLTYTAKNGVTISKRQLAKFLALKIDQYKIPRVFEQVDAIKHTYNGKLVRKFYNKQNAD